ncbi:cell wall hydrolase [Phenylobacterium sp.]|uniref:cell wall hydrolase n=1 Tax=Phenylobacterium sp. TaxID=1871053 RepID=UPI002DE2DC15|nr:cell wall hydrolase [Phenylobacterium sp.]
MRDDAIHLAGAQLAVVLMMSAGVGIAAVPSQEAPRLATVRLAPIAAATAQVQTAAAPGAEAPDAPVIRLQDLNPDQARRWNAANPIAKGSNPAAKPFKLNTEGVLDAARAADCMTAAIYYEAGFESAEGQRAVAQVVLNRMRHPAFPKTVCGVVFQGADRTGGGCQFTFTCDGALARKPDEVAWARARKVAEAALNGYVMKQVGEATHYHAEYVAPYWSPTLVKVAVVGQHIFYRWTGGAGLPPAFGGHYAGGEAGSLKIATLDNIGKAQTRASIVGATTDLGSAVSAHAPDAPATTKVAVAEKTNDMITAASATKDASAIVKPEELDWQGRPKTKTAPRIAMPGASGF